jgi:MYXO-CTERM domain-containing protein
VTATAGGTFTADVAVSEGLRSFTATAEDASGNVSGTSNTVTALVDRTAPVAPVIDAPVENGDVTAGLVEIRGTAEPGATVEVQVNGTTLSTVAAADGSFSVEVDLPEGDWTASVTARDAAGNVSPQVDRSFTAVPAAQAGGAHVSGGGGCSCSSTGGPSSSALLFLPLALAFVPRRRRAGRSA